ncbi:pyroglutamyl-peptidase I [Salisediminibacterium halotolerans]|uniref:Pyroglutamyl-peptidase I n=1 Tax=Salisediminibacterium halotolerans TaxID=517425 RepID=A0A1H9VGJ9_9BACI|nr:pyroglutamyl-peptidase I [Salisediminibacterium haloalkalitolerans]SES20805.1 pyroglutamyl-peptidase [Salisediminibacterium haloalkalitolerans]
MKILISGFEPFGGMKTNPAMELLDEIKEKSSDQLEIYTVLLPVVYSECGEKLVEKIKAVEPDAVIALGVAKGRASMQFEQIAINMEDVGSEKEIADNAGDTPKGRAVITNGPDGYFTTLPIRHLNAVLRQSGVPSAISNSAGTYICNTTMYHMLHYVRRALKPIPAGFIHVPAVPNMAVNEPHIPTMTLSAQLQGLQAVLLELERME